MDGCRVRRHRPKGKENGPVVDLVPELKKRDLHKRHRWTITKNELDLIAADIWPGINGPAQEIASVKGKAPKKPPLTTEGKWALERSRRTFPRSSIGSTCCPSAG